MWYCFEIILNWTTKKCYWLFKEWRMLSCLHDFCNKIYIQKNFTYLWKSRSIYYFHLVFSCKRLLHADRLMAQGWIKFFSDCYFIEWRKRPSFEMRTKIRSNNLNLSVFFFLWHLLHCVCTNGGSMPHVYTNVHTHKHIYFN